MQPTTFIIILFEGYRPLKQLHHLQYGVSPSNEFFVCRLYQDKAFCHDTGGRLLEMSFSASLYQIIKLDSKLDINLIISQMPGFPSIFNISIDSS